MNTVDVRGKRYQLASLKERFFAFLLDVLIILPFICTYVLLEYKKLPAVLEIISRLVVGDSTNWEVIIMLYFLIIDGLPNGQSFGKRIVKIQVIVETTGTPCTVGHAILRNFWYYILPIIDCAFVFGEKRQRLGDKIAQTRVVKPLAWRTGSNDADSHG